MLDLRAHTGLAPVGFLVGFRQGAVPVGTFVGVQKRIQKVFRLRRNVLEPFALLLAPVGAVTVEAGFLAMQQVRTTASRLTTANGFST